VGSGRGGVDGGGGGGEWGGGGGGGGIIIWYLWTCCLHVANDLLWRYHGGCSDSNLDFMETRFL